MILDRLQEALLEAGPFAQLAVDPVAGLLPPKMRFGGATYDTWRQVAELGRSRTPEADRRRAELLCAVLRTAVERSAFYAERTDLAVREISLATVWDCLSSFPIITRDDLASRPNELLAVSGSEVDLVTTSGSSGKPVRFYLPKNRRPAEWAFMVNAWYSATGYQLGDWRAVLRGLEFDDARPFRLSRAFSELRLSPFHMTPEWLLEYQRMIAEKHIRFVHGYPSAIDTLARSVLASGDQHRLGDQVHGVLLIGNPVTAEQRTVIARAFPLAGICVQYGLTERVAFAVERPSESGIYDVQPMYSTVEVLDEDNEPVGPGGRGRVIGTSHTNLAAPIIRYDTGDTATVVALDGVWPSARYLLTDIEPRRADCMLTGRDGRQVDTAAVNLYSTEFSHVSEYQFVQSVPGVVTIILVPVDRDSLPLMEAVGAQFAAKMGGAFDVTCEVRDNAVIPSSGKRRLVVSQQEALSRH